MQSIRELKRVTVERLEINVETNAGNAASQLKSLADAVQSVSKSAAKQTPVPLDTQKIISAATKVDVLKAKYEALAVAMNKAFIAGDTNKAWQLRGQMLQVEDALAKATAAANQNASATARVGTAARGAAHGGVSNFLASLKRIAFYRFIRSIVKSITEAFQEGLKNAYTFSKGLGGPLSKAMDELASKSYTMKNQLGAAFGELLTTIMPVVIAIVNAVRTLANALSQLFAALGGRAQYKYAKDIETAWDDAAGAAGDYKRTILGFDEINRLDSPGGGGGASALDPSEMFEYRDLPPWAEKLQEIISTVSLKIKDVFGEWGNWNTQKIKDTILKNLPTIAGATLIGGVVGGVKGAILGLTVGLALSFLDEADVDGALGYDGLIMKVKNIVLPVAGAILGWKLGGFGGAVIGLALGAMLSFAFSNSVDETTGQLNADKLLVTMLSSGVLAVAGAIIGWRLGRFGGAVIGITLGTIISLAFAKSLDEATGGPGIDKLLDAMMELFFPLGGAILGWKITHTLSGAAIGLTIGIGVALVYNVTKSISTGTGFGGTPDEFTLGAGATGYASGGFPSQGSLFVAGEAGAELVSTSSSGQTQVSNTNQIAASVSVGNVGVVQAINDLIRAVENKDTSPVVTIGDRDVYRANQRGQQKVGRSLVATV